MSKRKEITKLVREATLPTGDKMAGVIRILAREGKYFIERVTGRSRVRNIVDCYDRVEEGEVVRKPLSLEVANEIVNTIVNQEKSWSDAFVYVPDDQKISDMEWTKSPQEHKFTSTGIKFWRHVEQMHAYKNAEPGTVISTHISPEGACNLKCPYCSVTYRSTHSRIPLERIQEYVRQLKDRGLKAVILTGGGEPTIYKDFNKLVPWLKHDMGLSVGLISNGTQFERRVSDETMKCFSWVRVSINVFDGWEDKIKLDKSRLAEDCVVGCSMVYTVEHESTKESFQNQVELFRRVAGVADNVGAQYIRLLPNCLLTQDNLLVQHRALQNILKKVDDPRFFQQFKVHGAPKASRCHQAHFRPYLSEEAWHEDGESGTVYPCDSVVLNDSYAHFSEQYQVCKLEDVGKFLDRQIEMRFDPRSACTGCVFTQNVNMLDDWVAEGIERFSEFSIPMTHEEFV